MFQWGTNFYNLRFMQSCKMRPVSADVTEYFVTKKDLLNPRVFFGWNKSVFYPSGSNLAVKCLSNSGA